MRPLSLLLAVAVAADLAASRPSIVQLRVDQVPTDAALDRWCRGLGVLPPDGAARTSTGTGFLLGDPPVLVTNHHVVAGGRRVEVRDADDVVLAVVDDPTAVRADAAADLAIVAVDLPGRPGLALGPAPAEGAALDLLGFPDDGPLAARPGRAAGAVARALPGFPERTLALVEADVTHGMSGGPALDAAGRVVGVVLAGSTASSELKGRGVMLPRDVLADAVARLARRAPPPEATAIEVEADGRVTRAAGAVAALGLRIGDRIDALGDGSADVAAALRDADGPRLAHVASVGWVVVPL